MDNNKAIQIALNKENERQKQKQAQGEDYLTKSEIIQGLKSITIEAQQIDNIPKVTLDCFDTETDSLIHLFITLKELLDK